MCVIFVEGVFAIFYHRPFDSDTFTTTTIDYRLSGTGGGGRSCIALQIVVSDGGVVVVKLSTDISCRVSQTPQQARLKKGINTQEIILQVFF